ncbi:MAG: hypothetical protein ACAH89_00725 [Rariglobus sp.]
MHTSNSTASKRGSVLLSVVLFTAVTLIIIGSLLRWSMTERRLNYRHAQRLEARNAAEALAEYGFSQIRQKMETRSTVSLNPSGADALVMPASGFWTGSSVNQSSCELIGGTVELVPASGAIYYFNPADPNNENDPLRGKNIFRRDIRVIAKSTVNAPGGNGSPITAYVSQRISIRGAPLFAHAIFYNMDLEIFNGPDMTISGPVHTNGNLYLYPDNALNFSDQVTATGRVYHAKKPGDTSSDGNSASGRTGSVNFVNKFAQSLNLRDSSNIWKDSTQGGGTDVTDWVGFRDYASQRWNGNLQTAAHGVDNYTPVAIGKYQEDPTPANGTDNSLNAGRNIIEPTNYPLATDPDYKQKFEVEQQKYANNAGIYITVDPTTQSITVTSRNKDKEHPEIVSKALTLPAGNTLVTYKAYKATSTYSKNATSTTYSVGSKITSGPNNNKYPVTPYTTTTTTPYTTTITSGGSSTVAGTPATGSAVPGTVTYSPSPAVPSNTTGSSSTTPTAPSLAADNQGMYDQHRQKGTDLIDIDMDALRKAVAAMDNKTTAKVSSGSTVSVTATDKIDGLATSDWTGIVYIEVKGGPTTDPITGVTNSPTISSSMQTSVRIINGKGKVASYGTANEGLTIATNAPVYIKGNFNADGTTSTASPNSATTPETGEVPAAIVADAVTILSENFNDSTSLSSLSPTASTSTVEVAAALLVGASPTNKDGTGKTSGGAHNLPRFLENWSGKSVFIRGSLVALFETRIFTEPHGVTGYYSPPNRNWGFSTLFRDGRYPPGTPRVLSYRRVDFTDLTAAEYAAAKASFGW